MQPLLTPATAAHTSTHDGQSVALTDGVFVVLAVTPGDAEAVAVMLGDTEAVAATLGATDALAVADGVGLQGSQQSPWLVALPTQSQVVSGQSSRLHGAPSQAALDVSKRWLRGRAARSRAPASARRRSVPHVYPVGGAPAQPPLTAATAAHTAAHGGQGEALADGVAGGLADTLGDTDALSVVVGVGLHASQQAPWLTAVPTQSHWVGRQAR